MAGQTEDVTKEHGLVSGHYYGTINISGGNAFLGDVFKTKSCSKCSDIDAYRRRLCDSLRFAEINLRFNSVAEAYSQTFEWLFDGPSYQQPWDNFVDCLQKGEEMYLIEGKAGSGKSTLMRFIYQHTSVKNVLSRKYNLTTPIVLYHFFWLIGNELQRSFKGMLATLAFQLVKDWPSESFEAFYQDHALETFEWKTSLLDWSEAQLETIIFQFTDAADRAVFFLLDGLDEYEHCDKPGRFLAFISKLNSNRYVRLCVSSRPLVWLDRTFHKKLMLHHLTQGDIRKYASETLYEQFNLFVSDLATEHEAILQIITSKAEGVFLWVTYALNSLLEGIIAFDDANGLKQRLQELPKGMEDLFQHMWLRYQVSNSRHQDEAALFLLCGKKLPISLFDFTLITNENYRKHYLQSAKPLEEARLQELGANTRRKLMIRTAGLFTCQTLYMSEEFAHQFASSQQSTGFGLSTGPLKRVMQKKKTILPAVAGSKVDMRRQLALKGAHLCDQVQSQNVVYLHRTVHDFLWGTQFGLSLVNRPAAQAENLELLHLHAKLAAIVEDMAELSQSAVHELVDIILSLSLTPNEKLCAFESINEVLETVVKDRWGSKTVISWYYELQTLANQADTIICCDYFGYVLYRSILAMPCITRRTTSPFYKGYLLYCVLMSIFGSESTVYAYASMAKRLEVVKWLIQHDADLVRKHRSAHQFPEDSTGGRTFLLSVLDCVVIWFFEASIIKRSRRMPYLASILALMVAKLPADTTVMVPIEDFERPAWNPRTSSDQMPSPSTSCSVHVYCNFHLARLWGVIDHFLKKSKSHLELLPAIASMEYVAVRKHRGKSDTFGNIFTQKVTPVNDRMIPLLSSNLRLFPRPSARLCSDDTTAMPQLHSWSSWTTLLIKACRRDFESKVLRKDLIAKGYILPDWETFVPPSMTDNRH